ncbi:MAG: hypothetical protein KF819_03885 [Labilithrix sp.]|nr:hypothetical protein [Labilithrix sp.]
MKALFAISLLAALALGAPACSSGGPSGEAPVGPLVFAPEAATGGAVVFLAARPVLGDRLAFDVVARGAPQIHGAAFRLTWDPEALAFVSAERGEVWSKQVLALAKEGAGGQLAIAWTEKGMSGAVDATEDKILGTVTFDARGRKASSVGFKIERSTLVDRKGAHLPVTWRGGSIAAR